MKKRYQVFVSSTFRDLMDERRAIMQALLELDCIPAGMELFPASSDEAFRLIQRVIDESDYYVVVVGGRYGSVDRDGISYTEKEFDYATTTGKHILGFLHKDPDSIPIKHSEQEATLRARLQAFRAKVEKRLCKYWTNADELGGMVSRSLVQLISTYPAEGWVQTRYAKNVEDLEKVNQMHQQIRALEKELQELRKRPQNAMEMLAQGDDAVTLDYVYFASGEVREVDGQKMYGERLRGQYETTWNRLFLVVAHQLFADPTPKSVETSIANWTADASDTHNYGWFRIADETFRSIETQFISLGLIEIIVLPTEFGGHAPQIVWQLTDEGRKLLAQLEGVKKKAAAGSRP